ncbi:MAG: hypothetical protein IKQ46_03930 [Bacteroidales bacterium]|nr:hypothetical protein [Bacteroidales bacterium]
MPLKKNDGTATRAKAVIFFRKGTKTHVAMPLKKNNGTATRAKAVIFFVGGTKTHVAMPLKKNNGTATCAKAVFFFRKLLDCRRLACFIQRQSCPRLLNGLYKDIEQTILPSREHRGSTYPFYVTHHVCRDAMLAALVQYH